MEIIYKEKELLQLKQNKLGKGTCGCVYYDENLEKAVKIYHKEELQLCRYALLFSNNITLKENNVIVPEKPIYIGKDIRGYIMEKIEGYTFSQLITENQLAGVTIKDFDKAVTNAELNLMHIVKNRFSLGYDIHDQNLMYDVKNKRICFIDVDYLYKVDKKTSMKKLVRHHLSDLNLEVKFARENIMKNGH